MHNITTTRRINNEVKLDAKAVTLTILILLIVVDLIVSPERIAFWMLSYYNADTAPAAKKLYAIIFTTIFSDVNRR